MSKYRVHLSTVAFLSITVEVDDDLNPDDAMEQAIEKAYNKAPSSVCAHCSGWDRPWGLSLSDWEIDDDDEAVTREDGAS